MHKLKVSAHFSSAHWLQKYQGDCSRIHGHNWKVVVVFKVLNLNEIGMGYDFKEIKKKIAEKIDYLDHRLLNELEPFKKINPTAENISEYLFHQIDQIDFTTLSLSEIEVFESEKYSVIYSKDED